jgi:transcription-repair coupling factor (superfamily II helicase)
VPLRQYLERIADLPATADLLARLRATPPARLYAAPLLAAARLPLAAALAERLPLPLLVVVPNADAALRARDDLCAWRDGDDVLLWGQSDAMPYEAMSPGDELIGQRLRALRALADYRAGANDPDTLAAPPLLVASVRALLQPTLTPDEFAYATTSLSEGARSDEEGLLRSLLTLGYRSAATVEAPGELSRRGGIVDVWPVGDELPLRVEFFGDEVDSLRRFDPVTQRSEQRVRSATIGPPHEIPFWRLADALARLDAVNVGELRREARDEWQLARDRLERGERFEGRALFAPFFRERPVSLLDHMPNGLVVFADARAIRQFAEELHAQAQDLRDGLIRNGELSADFPRPYLLWEEVFEPGVRVQASERLALLDLATTPDAALLKTNPPLGRLEPVTLPDDLFTPAPLFGGQLKRLVADAHARLERGEELLVVSPQAPRIQELLEEQPQDTSDETQDAAPSGAAIDVLKQRATFTHGTLDTGWHSPALNLTLYSDVEIFGFRQRRPQATRKRRQTRSAEDRAAFLRGLKPGDYVVHIEHGIAAYEGLLRRTVDGIEREYLNLRYAGGDRIYVPVDQIDRVTRYIGAGDAAPTLTRLGTQDWERTKRELLRIYAARQLVDRPPYGPDTEWQRELEASFAYTETDDQLRALDEVKGDMERPTPMDRLICGDVGFGKTEVALRATFKAVQSGRQVAILVPTTVLAQQHLDTFNRRMGAFPVRVEMLSRFRTPKEQDAILKELRAGSIDILIGTHRLLSRDVQFKDLGLVVVDEEQRFGVRHKERLKQLRAEVDTLTLTATPIPRTLHMSLAGIRDMSVINTPPEDRVPIKTYVVPYDETLVREAILRELDRGGQVYYLHNRVQSIYAVADGLKALVPEARIGVGHGQLEEQQLEKAMLGFFNCEFDVLVCTTIIESGLDVPNANTIIIADATDYGLAQLYQLRGRVGRSANRAYAYLLYKQSKRMTDEARQRLEAIQEATELGAGFRIAMRDLEIRGAGNLLGAEQSGHIASVGFDLYSRLLEQAVTKLKQRRERGEDAPYVDLLPSAAARKAQQAGDAQVGTQPRPPSGARSSVVDEKVLVSPLVTLDLPLTAYLPTDYITDDVVRLAVYQRLSEAENPKQIRELRQELKDRFGPPPEPAEHLLTWLHFRVLALAANVSSVITTPEEFVVRLPASSMGRERLKLRFAREKDVRVGPQFLRLDRRALNGNWVPRLQGVLEKLAEPV